ncbi:hypothetical protein HDU97_005179 [Phlyctochytrium planicorne]|nr:hypothetical protein HDU97_005179 [Phlyctochytrium planicorne]
MSAEESWSTGGVEIFTFTNVDGGALEQASHELISKESLTFALPDELKNSTSGFDASQSDISAQFQTQDVHLENIAAVAEVILDAPLEPIPTDLNLFAIFANRTSPTNTSSHLPPSDSVASPKRSLPPSPSKATRTKDLETVSPWGNSGPDSMSDVEKPQRNVEEGISVATEASPPNAIFDSATLHAEDNSNLIDLFSWKISADGETQGSIYNLQRQQPEPVKIEKSDPITSTHANSSRKLPKIPQAEPRRYSSYSTEPFATPTSNYARVTEASPASQYAHYEHPALAVRSSAVPVIPDTFTPKLRPRSYLSALTKAAKMAQVAAAASWVMAGAPPVPKNEEITDEAHGIPRKKGPKRMWSLPVLANLPPTSPYFSAPSGNSQNAATPVYSAYKLSGTLQPVALPPSGQQTSSHHLLQAPTKTSVEKLTFPSPTIVSPIALTSSSGQLPYPLLSNASSASLNPVDITPTPTIGAAPAHTSFVPKKAKPTRSNSDLTLTVGAPTIDSVPSKRHRRGASVDSQRNPSIMGHGSSTPSLMMVDTIGGSTVGSRTPIPASLPGQGGRGSELIVIPSSIKPEEVHKHDYLGMIERKFARAHSDDTIRNEEENHNGLEGDWETLGKQHPPPKKRKPKKVASSPPIDGFNTKNVNEFGQEHQELIESVQEDPAKVDEEDSLRKIKLRLKSVKAKVKTMRAKLKSETTAVSRPKDTVKKTRKGKGKRKNSKGGSKPGSKEAKIHIPMAKDLEIETPSQEELPKTPPHPFLRSASLIDLVAEDIANFKDSDTKALSTLKHQRSSLPSIGEEDSVPHTAPEEILPSSAPSNDSTLDEENSPNQQFLNTVLTSQNQDQLASAGKPLKRTVRASKPQKSAKRFAHAEVEADAASGVRDTSGKRSHNHTLVSTASFLIPDPDTMIPQMSLPRQSSSATPPKAATRKPSTPFHRDSKKQSQTNRYGMENATVNDLESYAINAGSTNTSNNAMHNFYSGEDAARFNFSKSSSFARASAFAMDEPKHSEIPSKHLSEDDTLGGLAMMGKRVEQVADILGSASLFSIGGGRTRRRRL